MSRGSGDDDLGRQLGKLLIVAVMFLVCFGLVYLGLALRWPTAVNIGAPVAVACGVGTALWTAVARSHAKREHRTDGWTRKRTCHHCGYNLEGLKPPVRCPECGKPHLPRVA